LGTTSEYKQLGRHNGAYETVERTILEAAMLGDGLGYPRMSDLHQQRTPQAET
jgi:hypothetical protein